MEANARTLRRDCEVFQSRWLQASAASFPGQGYDQSIQPRARARGGRWLHRLVSTGQ
jgi:hypothetical protein